MNNEIGIYIHIPFCLKKCYYCDFISYQNKDELIDKYIYALCNEILKNAEILSQYDVSTIYIGGGTPSYIDAKYIKQILDTIYLLVNKENIKEITIELNPNSITEEKLKIYKESGINRLSIGLQSNYNKILKAIGRVHTKEDFEKSLDIINKVGFNSISVDLIYPLPNLSLEMFKNTVDYVVNLKDKNIKHISIYNLEVHENTKLAFLLKEGYISLVEEDEEYEMYKYLNETLPKYGYNRYEISNYSLLGFESKHNLKYWNQDKYLGFGVNASSFFGGTRYKNETNIEKYIDDILSNKDTIMEKEEMDLLGLMKEYIILSLRKTAGLNINDFKLRYKKDINDIFLDDINELITEGLLERKNNNIKLTDRGLEVANIVWERFI